MRKKLSVVLALVLAFLALMPSLAFADAIAADDGQSDIDFAYIDSQQIAAGDTEYIVLSFATQIDETVPLTLAIERDGDGSVLRFRSKKIVDNAVLFELSFDDDSTGVYSLSTVSFYSDNGIEKTINLISSDGKRGTFTVLPLASGASPRSGGDNTDIYSIADDGSISLSNTVEDAVGDVPLTYEQGSRSTDFIIVLDPGHGGSDPGATRNGIRESDVNLRIAQYCRQELEKFYGVEVIMTRDSDVWVGLEERAILARDYDADFFISFHVNSGGGTGAEVWVPAVNDTWHPSFHGIGVSIGDDILSKLNALGLVNRGTKFDYYDGRYYPDGSSADSLSVIRNCRLYGIPAILVEHGFIDNSYDSSVLKDEASLRQMGIEDARAIAAYFGLSIEQRPTVEASWMRNGEIDLTWNEIDGAERYAIALKTDAGYYTYTYDCTETNYTVKGLENGNEYQFLVQAFVDGRWTSYSDKDLFTCTLIPMPEARAEATGDGAVTLSWGAVDGAEAYAVAEYVGGRYVTYTLDCRDTTYTVSDLANGYEHSFLVQAKVGGRWSSFGPANLVKATPEGAMKPSVSARPADRSVTLTWEPVPGAERYAVAVREGSGWRTFTYDCRGTSYTAAGLSNGTEYEFLVQALCMGRWSSFGEGDVVKAKIPGTKIMGSSDVSISQMAALFHASGHEYPAEVYSSRGASTIEDFCQIVYEESASEGVKAEVLFSQAMVETGWLQFGGSVSAEQCNFGGLGAVSTSVAGASFPNVRIGLRAQVQHLKAYASTDPLTNSCVDPRFNFIKRGVAPTVEDLNGRWAVPGNGYGQSITSLIERMFNL